MDGPLNAPIVAYETPSAIDLENEARWETGAVERAILAYREARAGKAASELSAGRRLLTDVVPPLTGAIKEAQARARVECASPGGQEAWASPFLLFDAERLAVVALLTVLRQPPEAATSLGYRVPSAAETIAAAARDELEFEHWIDERRSVGDRRVIADMRARYPEMSRKAWGRWRKRVSAMREERWPSDVALAFGAKLIVLMVEAGPAYFMITEERGRQGWPARYLRLRPEALLVFEDAQSRAEVARPRLMPMLIPPIPWRYEDAQGG